VSNNATIFEILRDWNKKPLTTQLPNFEFLRKHLYRIKNCKLYVRSHKKYIRNIYVFTFYLFLYIHT